MATLSQLRAAHPTLLLIDAASASVQAGLWRADAPALWVCRPGEAGEQIFACVAEALAAGHRSLDAVDAFAFCDGPGSVLGIRTSAAVLRIWSVVRPRPVYAFGGLSVVARAAARSRRDFAVIADARRDSWHEVAVDHDGRVGPLRRVPTAALAGTLLMPEGFRHWSQPPPFERVVYALPGLLEELGDVDLFVPAPEPDAFLHEEPVYQTWTPRVHQAPAAP